MAPAAIETTIKTINKPEHVTSADSIVSLSLFYRLSLHREMCVGIRKHRLQFTRNVSMTDSL